VLAALDEAFGFEPLQHLAGGRARNAKHLGHARMDDELVLLRSKTDSPQWFVLKDDERALLDDSLLRRHLSFFTQL